MRTFESDIAYYTVKALVVVAGTLAMMASCMKIKHTRSKALLAFAAYLFWVGLYFSTAMKLFGMTVTLQLCIPMLSVPAMLLLYHLSNYSPWQAVFNYTMQLSVSIMLAISQTIAVTVLGGGKLADLTIRIGSYALCILGEYRFLRGRFSMLDHLPDKSWKALTLVPIGFTALIFLIGTYPVHYSKSAEQTVYVYAVAAVMLLVYALTFHSLVSQYHLQLSEYTNDILRSQSKSFQKQLEAINATQEQVRVLRHNMRYQLIVVSDLLAAGDQAGALDYIGSVGKKLGDTKERTYCSDPAANAILAYYLERAESRGIRTEVHFATPEKIQLDMIDFTAVVANALENAVNACDRVPENRRKLRVRTTESRQYIIEIANSCPGEVLFDEEGLPVSRESGHGIGTKSISAFAKKNHAMLDYDVEGEWFKLRIVFPDV